MSQAPELSGDTLGGLRVSHHLTWLIHPHLELLWLTQQTPGPLGARTSTRRLMTQAMEKMPRKKRSMTRAGLLQSSWRRWAAPVAVEGVGDG